MNWASDSKTSLRVRLNGKTCYASISGLGEMGLCLRFYFSKNIPGDTDATAGPRMIY